MHIVLRSMEYESQENDKVGDSGQKKERTRGGQKDDQFGFGISGR